MKKLALLLLLLVQFCFATGKWQTISTGLEYQIIPLPQITSMSKLHVFRINLSNYNLDLVLSADHRKETAFVYELARKHGAAIAINGGFFSPENKPLGLRVQSGNERNPLRAISWWGIFYIKGGQPNIVAYNNYQRDKQVHFAIQAGPRLVIHNTIPPLKAGFDERTAIGIDKNDAVIIAATENAPLSTKELAEILLNLGSVDAINLDGGNSTQLYTNTNDLRLNIANFSKVTDAIIVVPKDNA